MIETYRERFDDIVVGLPDHQNGIAMSVVAYMLGARVLEKHFTFNRAWKGTDQSFSLKPAGMGCLLRGLQRARVALGDGVKQMFADEHEPLYKMRKKLVAAQDVALGHVFTREDLAGSRGWARSLSSGRSDRKENHAGVDRRRGYPSRRSPELAFNARRLQFPRYNA